MIQRVYVMVVSGLDEDHLSFGVASVGAEVPQDRHYRDERELAAALERIASVLPTGCFFQCGARGTPVGNLVKGLPTEVAG